MYSYTRRSTHMVCCDRLVCTCSAIQGILLMDLGHYLLMHLHIVTLCHLIARYILFVYVMRYISRRLVVWTFSF